MSRPVMLSNGTMLVGLNKYGLVQDFYYPYVGLDNLTNSRLSHHKIGVWVDGNFSWMDDHTWKTKVNFENEALISTVTAEHSGLGIRLDFQDFVDCDSNALCRQIRVTNTSDQSHDIRIFLHQVFQISRAGRADTALYEPDPPYILDYKGHCVILSYGQNEKAETFDQYSIGVYGIEGKEGTYKDAEDGELSGNAVESGGVDSCIRFRAKLEPNATTTIDYWNVAASSQQAAERIHEKLLGAGLANRMEVTREYWRRWLQNGNKGMQRIDAQYLVPLKKSLLMIKAHMDKRGSILASGDSSIFNYWRDYYCYMWPRDTAYAIWPLVRLGFQEEAREVFGFCRDVLNPEGYLEHKYQPDRSIGSTWHPLVHGRRHELAIQEDETAIVLYVLGEYLETSGDKKFVEDLYTTLVQKAANFMSDFVDHETGLPHSSYDLWEQKFLTTTYTTATVYAALGAAARMADTFGYPDDAIKWQTAADDIKSHVDKLWDEDSKYFVKGFLLQENGSIEYDKVVDCSSLLGALAFGLIDEDDSRVAVAMETLTKEIYNVTPSGGMLRYVNDDYFLERKQYKGNPWLVCTLWYAQYLIRTGKRDDARTILDWTMQKATESGVLSEQIDPETSGLLGVAPLVWSHAELARTILDLQ